MVSFRQRPERSRTRLWGWLAVVLILAAIVGGPLFVAYRVAHPGLPQAAASLQGARDVSFAGAQGAGELKGSYLAGEETAVIFLHGYGANRLQGGQAPPLAVTLHDAGYSVLLYDQRRPATFGPGESADAATAIAYVRGQGARRVVLLGWGLGASTALHAAARQPGVDALVLIDPAIGPGAELERIIAAQSPLPDFFFAACTRWLAALVYGVRPGELRPLYDAARTAPRPVLLIARGDALEGAGQLLSVTGQTGNELFMIPEQAGPEGYVHKVAAFLAGDGATGPPPNFFR